MTAQAQGTTAPAAQTSGWRDGFFIQSDNGDYRLQIGGLVHADGRFALGSHSMTLVGEFDRKDNNIGYNTGFSSIKLDTPKVFYVGNDTIVCRYQFPPKGDNITNLNGWQYLYGISAFDGGDSANGLASLESAKIIKRVVPGTTPTSDKNAEVIVYPNPRTPWARIAWRVRKQWSKLKA